MRCRNLNEMIERDEQKQDGAKLIDAIHFRPSFTLFNLRQSRCPQPFIKLKSDQSHSISTQNQFNHPDPIHCFASLKRNLPFNLHFKVKWGITGLIKFAITAHPIYRYRTARRSEMRLRNWVNQTYIVSDILKSNLL